jgi:hypothetical protein
MKNGINFVHFILTTESEMKPRVNIMIKKGLSVPTIQIEETHNEI